MRERPTRSSILAERESFYEEGMMHNVAICDLALSAIERPDEARKAADYIMSMIARGARVTAEEKVMAHAILGIPTGD